MYIDHFKSGLSVMLKGFDKSNMSTKCSFLESLTSLSKSITRDMNIKWYFPNLSQLLEL